MANKNSKTKKRIGIAAAMLGLVVAVGATAGTTLAKYISSHTVESQTATVAQWGYTITANANNLFGEYYEPNGSIATKTKDSVVVSSEAEKDTLKNVVAPNTKGSMTLAISGSAEVDALLTINVDAFESVWLLYTDSDTYYPLEWKVNEIVVNQSGDWKNDLATAIATAIHAQDDYLTAKPTDGKVTVELPDNNTVNISLTISWEWKFETGDTEDEKAANNVLDTILGSLAAGTETRYAAYGLNTTLGLTATIEQVKDSSSGSGLTYPNENNSRD